LQLSSTGANQIGIAFNPATQDVAIAGTMIINANGALTNSFVASNSNTIVTGTIRNNGGVITSSAVNLNFNAGSIYNHATDAGVIPTATWNIASNLNITGLTATAPTAGLGQVFGNINYSSSYTLLLGANLTVAGNLDISSGSIDGQARTINLSGNLTGTNGLTFTGAGTLLIGGNYTNTGTFTAGTGTVNYNGTAQQVKSTAYYNLTISGSADKTMQGDVTVDRTATFTAGSLVLNGNTLNLNYATNPAGGTITGSSASNLSISGAGTPAMTLPNITGGLLNLTMNKTGANNTVTLGGNLDITGAANFTAGALVLSGRTLSLNGTTSVGAGTITGSAASIIGIASSDNAGMVLPNITGGLLNFTVNKTGTTNTVALGGALTIGGVLTLSDGALLLNNFLLTINGSLNQTTGTITGGGTSDITIGTPAAPGISVPAVANGVRNLILNRTAGITLTGDNTITGALTLTTGKITLGTNNLTLSGIAAVGGASAANFIVADGTGQLKKVFATGATAAYTLPIGDVSGNYSPVILTFTGNSIQRTIGVRVTDALHPNDGGSSDNISRYWSFSDDQAGTYTYNATFTYITPADLTGVHANLRLNRWNGSVWTQYTNLGASPNLTVNGITETTAPLNNNDFTGRVNGPATYRWNQTGSADWTNPSNWTPNRLSAQPNDILIFDNNGTTTATNVPLQTIERLIISNTSDVTLEAGAAATLIINNAAGTELDINSGNSLSLSTNVSLTLSAGTTAVVDGTLSVGSGNTFTTSGAATVTSVSGTINNSGTIAGTVTGLVFGAGSNYNHTRDGGAIPTATWNLTSNCNISGLTASPLTAGMGQTFGNVNYSSAYTLTLTTALPVTGNLDISAGTIAAAGQTINLSGNLTGTGGLSFTGGILNISGNFSNSGTFTCGTGTVNYIGAAQQVKGTTYNNLTVLGGNVKTLLNPAIVNATLTLTSGVLKLDDNDLTLNNTTAIAGSPFGITNMIETNGAGRFIRSANAANQSFNLIYPVGSGGFYNPLIITLLPNSGAAPRIISVGAIPTNLNIVSNSINKYWDLSATNIATQPTTVLSFQYNAGEVVGDPLLFQPYTNGSGSWAIATGPSFPGSNPATSTGSGTITGFWTVGSPSTFYSYQSGFWDQASTWTFDPGGTTGPGTKVPGQNDKVVILTGRTVTLQADDFTQNLDIRINNGGILDQTTFRFSSTLAALRGDGV
jgi:fibronectin-binding autotransporter adhesin